MTNRIVKIVRVTEDGLIYAKDPALNRLAGFTFGKLQNYHGESARELSVKGLRPGQQLAVEYDEEQKVQSARFVAAARSV